VGPKATTRRTGVATRVAPAARAVVRTAPTRSRCPSARPAGASACSPRRLRRGPLRNVIRLNRRRAELPSLLAAAELFSTSGSLLGRTAPCPDAQPLVTRKYEPAPVR
jgi:hypothetical protein